MQFTGTQINIRMWIVFAVVLATAQFASATPLKILPLGDSITDGGTALGFGLGAYRTQLWKRFGSDPTRVDFLGSQNDGPDDLGDKDHEGHCGFGINSINGNLESVISGQADTNGGYWLTGTGSRPAIYPDIVLLHIGSNEVHSPTGASGRLDNLIKHIFMLRPTTTLIVASIIPRTDLIPANELLPHDEGATFEPIVQAYNAEIPAIVERYKTAGNKIFFVDMHSKLDPDTDYKVDKIHPNTAGYNKMGDAWYEAIQTATAAPEPGAVVLLGTGAGTLACFGWRQIIIAKCVKKFSACRRIKR